MTTVIQHICRTEYSYQRRTMVTVWAVGVVRVILINVGLLVDRIKFCWRAKATKCVRL